jgi:hypothetical protein
MGKVVSLHNSDRADHLVLQAKEKINTITENIQELGKMGIHVMTVVTVDRKWTELLKSAINAAAAENS